jgi:transcriptional regulator with XRE-family HTH domain
MQTAQGVRPQFTIGDRLRKARMHLDQNMSADEFGELIGTSKNTIHNYELERTAPERMKLIVLRQWALATGVDLAWLLDGDGGPDGDVVETPRKITVV